MKQSLIRIVATMLAVTMIFSVSLTAVAYSNTSIDSGNTDYIKRTMDGPQDGNDDTETGSNPTALTRADLEAAVVELGFAYHLKGDKIQYDSVVLTEGLDHYHGATYRLTRGVAPEYGTSDTTIYSVCSDYIYKVYSEALDYLMFGSQDYLDATTTAMWLFSEQNGAAKMRWMSDSFKNGLSNGDESDPNTEAYWGITAEDSCTIEEMRSFLANWEENLRPGDVILPTGHAMLYVGNGYVLDCFGIKYNMDTGLEYAEGVGGVPYLRTVEDLYLDGDDQYVGSAWCLNDNSTFNWFLVIRPLDMLVDADTDEMLSNDVVKDSNYTLPADTLTRLSYPGMEIDRTVNATPFGTVAQNGTLTYSVAISNKSNAETYTRWMEAGTGDDYSGETYEGLVITETIPEGTELVEGSISNNGTYADGMITWTVNLDVGACVELTYTVRATAERGTVIVNDGGFVGGIASNSISNTVGGADLSESALQGLANFGANTASNWRANYNISNTATGLTFAERVYAKAMGIGLELPDLQTVVDNLFEKQTITNPSGSIRFTHSMTADLLVLQSTVPEAYQSVRDMMVASYVGGTSLYFDNAVETINELHVDYLTAGDILVYANLDVNDQITDHQVLVSLGDGAFASLTSDHKMTKISGESAKLLVWKAFTYDLFFALRPSEAFDNVSVMAYDLANEPVYGDEIVIIDPTMQKRQLPLSDDNKAELVTAGATGWSNANVAFALDVYRDVMGIDLSEHLSGLSQTSILAELFYDAGHNASTGSAHFYTLLDRDSDEIDNKHLYDMLVESLCGGPDMDTSILEGAVSQMQISDLEAGDILTLGTRSGNRDYWAAVYLGEGKLLLAIYDAASKTKSYELRNYSGENAENFAGLFQEREWQYWFVLRPYLGYDDINDETIAEVVEAAPLSEENKQKLMSLAGTLETGVTAVNSKFAGQIYALINLDIDGDGGLGAMSSSNLRAKLFQTSGGIHTKMASAVSGYEALYQMLVPGYFGGSKMNTTQDNSGEVITTIDPADASISNLEIGDVLILGNQTTKDYWTGVYLGNGKMIMSQYKSVAGNLGTIELWDFTQDSGKYAALLQSTEKNWEYFFLLRPSEGYADINTRLITPEIDYVALSAENQAKLTALATSYVTGTTAQNAKFAGMIYKEIGLDIDTNGLGARSSSSLLQTMFNSQNNTVTMQANPNNTVVRKMLVSGYFGGKQMATVDTNGNPVERKTEFAVSDLEIGDVLVMGRYKVGTISADYWTGVYLGEGKMLISQYKSETGNLGTIELHDFSGNKAANYPALLTSETLNWDYFFLLRPYLGFENINNQTVSAS